VFFFDGFFFLIPLFAFVFVARVIAASFRSAARRRLDVSQPPSAEPPRPRLTGKVEGRVYGLAYRLGGRLTVSDVVIETGLGTREAEQLLDGMADETHVRVQVTDDGRIRYEFPEILDRIQRERGESTDSQGL
jgi:hypothetical protein